MLRYVVIGDSDGVVCTSLLSFSIQYSHTVSMRYCLVFSVCVTPLFITLTTYVDWNARILRVHVVLLTTLKRIILTNKAIQFGVIVIYIFGWIEPMRWINNGGENHGTFDVKATILIIIRDSFKEVKFWTLTLGISGFLFSHRL